jgi:hypothetical protein
MSTEKFESPIEEPEPAPVPAAESTQQTDDVEGHSLLLNPSATKMLDRAHQDDVARQAEKHRREHEAKHPLQPRGRS